MIQEAYAYAKLFQLTTSHRGRQIFVSKFVRFIYFNSLPHTEVDGDILCLVQNIYGISTHYLTQR